VYMYVRVYENVQIYFHIHVHTCTHVNPVHVYNFTQLTIMYVNRVAMSNLVLRIYHSST